MAVGMQVALFGILVRGLLRRQRGNGPGPDADAFRVGQVAKAADQHPFPALADKFPNDQFGSQAAATDRKHPPAVRPNFSDTSNTVRTSLHVHRTAAPFIYTVPVRDTNET